jgi:uncharacterized phage protein (TIGR01671 family)
MREIKFRAWDKLNNEFVGCYSNSYRMDFNNGHIYAGNINFTNRLILQQYIGLTDKNDKEIYEGDMIGFIDCTDTEGGWYEQQCIGVVEWSSETASFEVSNRLSAESYEVLEECIVLGNIYENPELLKGEEE